LSIGKQADRSAKTREAKLVTIWTAESRDEEGKPVRDPGSITYSAALESSATRDTSPDLSDFAARVQREASRRDFHQAPRQAVLGDGSTWIGNTTAELFPRATQILDRFHAKEHLSQAGRVIYGDSPEVKPASGHAMTNSTRAT
jgi:transposase